MNCVNCGAAPRDISQTSCIYCESVLDERVPEADLDGFHQMLRVLQITKEDCYKVDIVERFRKKFTAGQVRQLLATFDEDVYRVDAAEHLVPRTINPVGLLGCADLFNEDVYRSDFVKLLDEEEEEEEDSRAPPPPVASPSYVGRVLLLLIILLLGLNLVWMASR